MKNGNFTWSPVSKYTGGRVLATNGLDVLIGEINSDGDCESEEDSSTILCGITGFIQIEEILPELKESEDEKIRKLLLESFKSLSNACTKNNCYRDDITYKDVIAWLEKQGEHSDFLSRIQIGDKVTRNEDGVLVNFSQLNRVAKKDEKQGKNNMGISEATKQKLEDNLNKALEKETQESMNEFLDEQGEQKPVDFSDLRTWKYIVDAVWTEKEGIGQYLDSPFTEEVAKKLQKRFGNIEQNLANSTNNCKDEQKSAEWNEEDENRFTNLIFLVKCSKENDATKEGFIKFINKVKSLRPQNTWKPSDAQMDALYTYIYNPQYFNSQDPRMELVESVYQDLKKLRGE